MKTALVAAVGVIVLTTTVDAQSPMYAQPSVIGSGTFQWEIGHAPLPGATLSPDGRLMLSARFSGGPTYNVAGWWLSVLRPEAVTQSSQGIPQFPEVAFLQPGISAWSIGHMQTSALKPMENELEPWQRVPATTQHTIANYQFRKQWVSMCPDPAFRDRPCPFPSNTAGVPLDPKTPGATCETYRMLIVAADNWEHVDTSATNTVTWPRFVATGGVSVLPMGMRTMKVVVANPRTTNASISSADVGTTFSVLHWQSASGPVPILGLEPSLSLDGRLLVFQGNVVNNTRPWNSASTDIQQLLYTFNPTPGVAMGWTEPRPINEMFVREQSRVVNGVPFSELYPIARAPMTNADGSLLTTPFEGAYPWMTLDGTDVVFSARHTNEIFGSGRRRTFCMIGRSTGHALRYVDGPLNPDRDVTERVITAGTGFAPGAWQWGGDTTNLRLPYLRHSPVLPIFDAENRRYGEIDVHEKLDGSFLLALDMNEYVQQVPAPMGWKFDKTRTADTSGFGHTGVLQAGAQFPQEVGKPDATHGVVGQCIFFKGTGFVQVANSAVLSQAQSSLTVACWVSQSGNATPAAVVDKPGSYQLAVDPQGRVRATLQTTAGTVQTPFVGSVQASQWRHVAFTYDPTGTLLVLVDGQKVHVQPATPGALVLGSTSALTIGPAGLNIVGGVPQGTTMIDQVRVSSVARTEAELARDAFRTPSPTNLQQLPTSFALPLGLDRVETKVPTANVPDRLRIDLGDKLFHDAGLSPSGVSCSTCHVDGLSFTDGLAQRTGPSSGQLLRNAPTVVNRVFSTTQFFDGRADDLEAQVLHPLFNPDEMRSNSTFVLTYLNSPTSGYVGAFQQAYGSAPTLPLVQAALASYQRALVTGGAPADHYENGSATLTAGAIRGRNLFFGKARCFGCHSGSNYTDERFHVSLFKPVDPLGALDLGRGGVTGIAGDMFRFKTPTLRNLVDTAPYFHDGRANTLRDVIDFYDVGGDFKDPVDGEIFPLGLTNQEKIDLEDFLKSLSAPWTKL